MKLARLPQWQLVTLLRLLSQLLPLVAVAAAAYMQILQIRGRSILWTKLQMKKGYASLYDFLLWFPAKATSRLNRSGYAFVNFRHAEDAHRFRHQLHLSRLKTPEGETEGQAMPLSIAVAKVQGFADNYTRFQHLLDGSAPTRCKPFFASDAVASLSEEDVQAAVQAASAAKAASVTHSGTASAVRHDKQATTLVIRNLPFSVDTQVDGMQWLGGAGIPQEQYDFFPFLPAKRKARAQGTASSPQTSASQVQGGLGYCFVNFKSAQRANTCLEALGGCSLQPGDPTLSVVSAKIQGINE